MLQKLSKRVREEGGGNSARNPQQVPIFMGWGKVRLTSIGEEMKCHDISLLK